MEAGFHWLVAFLSPLETLTIPAFCGFSPADIPIGPHKLTLGLIKTHPWEIASSGAGPS